jgi:hypothetical protein
MILHDQRSGNVLFVLLVGIALFAGLTVAVTQSGKNVGGAKSEKATLAAAEIMEYAGAVRSAVQRLTFRGCAAEDISFENDEVSGYEHMPVAKDKCKVFNASGGGLRWKTPDTEWLETAYSSNTFFVHYKVCIKDVGTNGADISSENSFCDNAPNALDLVIAIVGIKKTVCEAINKKINGSHLVPLDVGDHNALSHKFDGVYRSEASFEYADANYLLASKMSYCFQASSSTSYAPNSYVFYQVLLAR